MIQIYHNSRCTKSRECLSFFEKSGKDYEIIKYLEEVPTMEELKSIIIKLDIKPIKLVRTKEKIWLTEKTNITINVKILFMVYGFGYPIKILPST